MLKRISRGFLAVSALCLLTFGNNAIAGVNAGPLSGGSVPVIPAPGVVLPTVVIQEFPSQYSIEITGPTNNPWSIVAFGVVNRR